MEAPLQLLTLLFFFFFFPFPVSSVSPFVRPPLPPPFLVARPRLVIKFETRPVFRDRRDPRFLRFFFSCATGRGVNNKGIVKSSSGKGVGWEKNVGWNSWLSLKRGKVELINEDRIFVTL